MKTYSMAKTFFGSSWKYVSPNVLPNYWREPWNISWTSEYCFYTTYPWTIAVFKKSIVAVYHIVEDVSNYHFLSNLFGISVSVVGSEITNMLSAVCEKSNRYLAWPTEEVWRSMHVTLTKLPMAVGAIDGTSHRIYRPEVERMLLLWSASLSGGTNNDFFFLSQSDNKHGCYVNGGKMKIGIYYYFFFYLIADILRNIGSPLPNIAFCPNL